MVSQQRIEDHARNIDSLVSSFASQIRDEVELVMQAISMSATEVLKTKDGKIEQTPENSAAILGLEGTFHRELAKSGFYPAIVAFASGLADEVEEFRDMHREADLPDVDIDDETGEALGNQAAAAIVALEGHVARVGANLRQFLARAMGGVDTSALINGVSDIVRKTAMVESISRDHVYIFLRLLAHLSYQNLEENGVRLRYRYAGPESDRDFCEKLLRSSSFSREEVSEMDNGQIPDAFINAGGYGCQHFWLAELA